MSISLVSTPVYGIFATQDTALLVETFLSCSVASRLLNSEQFIKPMIIESSNLPFAKTLIGYIENSLVAKIEIPEKILRKTKALEDLAFEIFNTQPSSNEVNQAAELGNVGMDSYARQIEEQEYLRTLQHHKLISQCSKAWKLPPERVKHNTYIENRGWELNFFNQEYGCHTDYYRKKWIELYQKNYCKNQPDDTRSCMTNKADLCDFEKVQKLSPWESSAFLDKRICKLFPQAHEKVKNDPDIRMIIQENCPEALIHQDL